MSRDKNLEFMEKVLHLTELEMSDKIPFNYIHGSDSVDERIEMLENLIYKGIQPTEEQYRKFFDYEGVFTEYIN